VRRQPDAAAQEADGLAARLAHIHHGPPLLETVRSAGRLKRAQEPLCEACRLH
jgi:hypothetical protein